MSFYSSYKNSVPHSARHAGPTKFCIVQGYFLRCVPDTQEPMPQSIKQMFMFLEHQLRMNRALYIECSGFFQYVDAYAQSIAQICHKVKNKTIFLSLEHWSRSNSAAPKCPQKKIPPPVVPHQELGNPATQARKQGQDASLT